MSKLFDLLADDPSWSGGWTTSPVVAGNTLKMDDLIKGMEAAKKSINELQKIADTSWILISPQGEVSKGTIQQLVAVLMKHHPLFNQPITYFPVTEK